VVEYYDERIRRSFAKMIDIKNVQLLRDEMLYDVKGGNIPDYPSHREELYENSRLSAIAGNGKRDVPVRLTRNNIENFTSPESSHDRQWTHYLVPTRLEQLSPSEYACALAIRCGMAPDNVVEQLGETFRCECNALVNTRTQLAAHICSCMFVSNYKWAHRHTLVKDGIRNTLNRYGILSHNEPAFYAYPVRDCRPDLTVRLYESKCVATDITVVVPDPTEVGKAATKAAEEKIKKHQAAVAEYDHEFIPFALETTGHFDARCFTFFKRVASHVPFHQRTSFGRDFFGAISLALAKYRALSMLSASRRGYYRE
jgi:hypothetical protein